MAEKQQIKVADKDLPITDQLGAAPSIFIDGMQGSIHAGGIVKIGLYQVVQEIEKLGEPNPITKLIVGRLIMTQRYAFGGCQVAWRPSARYRGRSTTEKVGLARWPTRRRIPQMLGGNGLSESVLTYTNASWSLLG